MSKKIFLIILIILGGSFLSLIVFKIVIKTSQKKEVATRLANIPTFNLTTLDDKEFTNSHLRQNINTVFIYFNSTCDFCQHEAQSISENLESFKDTQILFVSNEPIDLIKDFSKTYQLDNKNQITFLHDSLDVFSAQFDANSIPYILIYNTKSKLIKTHKGQLNAGGILKHLNSQP